MVPTSVVVQFSAKLEESDEEWRRLSVHSHNEQKSTTKKKGIEAVCDDEASPGILFDDRLCVSVLN